MHITSKRVILTGTILMLVFIYFWRLGFNDIWNPNEGYYADAVRVMMEQNNYWEFYFNGELRFNKPPVTYWAVAASVWVFGLNEFAIRFPMSVMTLATIFLTFLLGKAIGNKKTGILAGMIMALSLQFAVNARYSSPEIPLTFFFTLTMFLFYIGYTKQKRLYLHLSYISLGLTLLAKGFPYLLIIGAIIVIFILFDCRFSGKRIWERIKLLQPHFLVPIVVIIGFSWPVSMYLIHGEKFLSVLSLETTERAFSYDSIGFLKSLFYYTEINSWGFIPYSLVFYFALYHLIKKKNRAISYPLIWFIVMYVVFTIAKGKIPTYFIQAHPAMAIITAYYLARFEVKNIKDKVASYFLLWFPSILYTLLGVALIYAFKLSPLLYIFVLIPAIAWLMLNFGPGTLKTKLKNWLQTSHWDFLVYFPFYSFMFTMCIFAGGVLSEVEEFRPYQKIGEAIEKENISSNIPLILQDRFMLNLPYYAQRRVELEKPLNYILSYRNQNDGLLAMVDDKSLSNFPESKVIWTGWIYTEHTEAKFFKFVTAHLKAKNGDFSEYKRYNLIYKPK